MADNVAAAETTAKDAGVTLEQAMQKIKDLEAEIADSKSHIKKLNDENAKRRKASGEVEKTAEELQAEVKSLRDAADKRDLDDAVRAVATSLKFRNPRYAFVADLKGVVKGDDGKYDVKAIEAALQELIKTDPDIVTKDIKPIPGTPRYDGGRGAAKDEVDRIGAEYKAPPL